MSAASETGDPALPPDGPLALADWRRRVAELYAAVRAAADPQAAWHMWRQERDHLIARHPRSPLPAGERASFEGLPFYAYDPALRYTPQLTPVDKPIQRSIDVGPDGRITIEPLAETRGLTEPLGGELTLFWIAGYGGGVFLPFLDGAPDTYQGGRYLLDSIKGADLGATSDGRAVLDFNFAYNPSCAYSDDWVCPLAPAENRLDVALSAGERVFW